MRTSLSIIAATVVMLVLLLIGPPQAGATCTVCHSKNPKMVRMHKALEFKDCFQCHGTGRIKPPPEQKKQMRTDELCIRCHGQ